MKQYLGRELHTVADWELVEAASLFDTRAGSELVRRYYHMVLRYFRSKLAHVGDSESQDCTQNVFVICMESGWGVQYYGSRCSASGRTWAPFLLGVARNVLGSYIRRMGVRNRREIYRRIRLRPRRTPPGLETVEKAIQIRATLSALPAKQRLLVELFFASEDARKDAAALLGLSMEQILGRIERAVQELRREIRLENSTYSRRELPLDEVATCRFVLAMEFADASATFCERITLRLRTVARDPPLCILALYPGSIVIVAETTEIAARRLLAVHQQDMLTRLLAAPVAELKIVSQYRRRSNRLKKLIELLVRGFLDPTSCIDGCI